MTAAHASQLLDLASRHEDAAESARDWPPLALDLVAQWAAAAKQIPVIRRLSEELELAASRAASAPIRTTDVMHCDFHHRNFLAEGERVTGVFDWELSCVGDWRFDVVTLGFWSAIPRAQVPETTGRVVLARMKEVCEPDALAFFSAVQAMRHLAFDLSVHPERLERVAKGIEAKMAPWWRTVL
jgi:aminoglycoside phosphotransferase (APT) family kinase protein